MQPVLEKGFAALVLVDLLLAPNTCVFQWNDRTRESRRVANGAAFTDSLVHTHSRSVTKSQLSDLMGATAERSPMGCVKEKKTIRWNSY